jgi:uncharacterized lipoprotein YddW (UPF0748 family)
MKAASIFPQISTGRFSAAGSARRVLCLLVALACWPPASMAQSAPGAKSAKPARPSHNIWVSLAHSTLDVRPPDWAWLREQCAGGRILETLAPARKQIAGIVVPVFDDGRTFYETKVEPFAGRNKSAAQDEAALRELLARARAQGVPVYLGLDVLAWQKSDISDWHGLLASRPEWEEFTTYGASEVPHDARFASPFHKDVRQSLNALVEEIAARFPEAAGVVLDVRFSDQQINGFGMAARAQFARRSRLDPADFDLDNIANLDLNPVLRQWVEWRCDALAEFVGALADAYRKASRGKVLVNGYAEYYVNRDFHDVRTAQDWLGWARGGRFDGVLLEGRWLNPFPDIDQLQRLRAELSKASREAGRKLALLAVSTGNHLVKTSDYAKEYRALVSRPAELDGVALLVRGDEDLQRAVAFASGATPPEMLPPLAVGAPLPDFTLPLAGGAAGEWSSKSARGRQSVALLLARDARLARNAASALAARTGAKGEDGVIVLVSESGVAASATSGGFVHVVDAGRYLLDRVNAGFALVLVDRAGYVRRIEQLPAEGQVLSSALAARFGDVTPALEEGRPAPEFTMLDSAGREVRLAEFRGRKHVLLTFFPKCFTDG